MYLAVGSVALVTYLVCTVFVYLGEKDFEQSVANTRNNTQTTSRVNTNDLEFGKSQSDAARIPSVNAAQTTPSVPESDIVKLSRSKVLISSDPREKVASDVDAYSIAQRQSLY